MNAKIKKLLKISIGALILTGSFLFLKKISPKKIREIISSYGSLMPLVYILLISILPVFFVPIIFFVLPAGIAFGLLQGTVYTMVGSFFNCIIMFYISRFVARDSLKKFLFSKFSKNFREKIFSTDQKKLGSLFFVLRLVPLISYNLINYAAGLTEINLGTYLITSMVGIFPGLVLFLNLGDKALDTSSREFKISILSLVILGLISIVILKIFFSSDKNGQHNNSNLQ